MRLVLFGLRGAGKTTVGRLVAERLGWPFIDTDALVVERAGRAIRDIFERDGEARFRDLETEVLRESGSRDRCVIAIGGGALERPGNHRLLGDDACFVWLTAPDAVLLARMRGDPANAVHRPPLLGGTPAEELVAIRARREPIFRELSDLELSTDGPSPRELAERITEWLSSRGRPGA